jgi:hypothetical protein
MDYAFDSILIVKKNLQKHIVLIVNKEQKLSGNRNSFKVLQYKIKNP